ncbi:MAG: chitobiase/beta-hexosaminidase C-terminal domain-containing protein [Candidatus Azobacteroides sp.]|nr:chitobiase/beta-hexosaminidase C-terminal domain-containing protein [Candidatus Azobacteroides sp.]
MKKTNFLFSFITAIMLLCGGSIYAQTPNALMTAVDAAKSGAPGPVTITLSATAAFNATTGSYVLESTPSIPLTIDCGTFALTATGVGISLTVGANVTITGSASPLLSAVTNGTIIVDGATITGSGAQVVSATSGPVTVNSGTITATGTTGNPCALWATGQPITVTGGTITAGGAGRCIRTQGNVDVSNATFYANDAATNALHSNNGSAVFNISGTLVFHGNGTAIALNSTSVIKIAAGAVLDNQMDAGKLLSGTSATSAIFDYNAPFNIITDTTDGTTFPDANGIVNISVDNPNGNTFPGYVGFYYTTDGSTPTASSPFANSTNTVAATAAIQITSEPMVIKARIGRSGAFWDESTVYTFTYHAQGLDPAHPIFNVTNFTQLKDAYTASQAAGVVSSTIVIGAAFSITDAFTVTPTIPVTITNKNSLTTGANTVFGGALTINIDGNPLIIGGNTTFNDGLVFNGTIAGSPDIKTAGTSTVLTVNGGELNTTGTGTFIQLSSAGAKIIVNGGSLLGTAAATLIQISNATASIEVNGGAFEVDGTGTNARAFQISSGGGQVTINDGTITVGGGGRGVHLASAGTVKINGGSITMNGTNTASQIIRFDNTGANYVEINGATLNAGKGNVVAFNTNQNNGVCVVKAATIDLAGGIAYLKNGPGDGSARGTDPETYYGVQKIYDFRGLVPVPDVAPAVISEPISVSLSLPASIDPDPVDATGAAIYYNTKTGTVVSADSPYSAPISIVPGTILNVFAAKDGYTSNSTALLYDKITGIDVLSTGAAKAYIEGNTLYLPESGNAVQVYNVSGQLVLNVFATGTTVDISSLSKGIYIVKAGASTFKAVK